MYGYHPAINDIPPVASQGIPAVAVHPMEGLPLEKGQLHAAASDAIDYGLSGFTGPRYNSHYDPQLFKFLYSSPNYPERVAPRYHDHSPRYYEPAGGNGLEGSSQELGGHPFAHHDNSYEQAYGMHMDYLRKMMPETYQIAQHSHASPHLVNLMSVK